MAFRIAIVALCALGCLSFSGCGCSKEKPQETAVKDVPSRMQDVAYTNQLVQLHEGRKAVAANAAAIRAQIGKLGPSPEGKPEYMDLTNRLAQCEAEMERIRKETLLAVRARISKDIPPRKNGNLKK